MLLPATRTNIALLAVLSALLSILAWPATYLGWTPLVFVAWVPMYWAERLHDARTAGRRRAFTPYVLLGLLIWNAATTWWLGAVNEPLGTRLFTGMGPTIGNTLVMGLPWVARRAVRRRMGAQAAELAFPAFWLAFEHLHMDWDLTWPWLTLGNVFAERTTWVQWYEWTGHLGGTLWVLGANLLVFRASVAYVSKRPHWRRMAGWSVAAIALPLIVSFVRLRIYVPQGRPVEVVAVQPDVDPYSEKYWSDPIAQLDDMLALAEGAMTDSTALVIFPETALQERTTVDQLPDGRLVLHGLWENELAGSRSVQRIVAFLQRHPRTAVLAGMSSDHLFGPNEEHPFTARHLGGTDRFYEPYNAALLVRPDGSTEPYHKSKLVAFVEIMPFERFLGPLIDYSVDLGGTTGSLGTQTEREVMSTSDGSVKAAPIICYESVFADHVAAHVRNGANLLTILTNDGWWGTSPGYRQHLQYGRLRAIETRRDIARSANTGISCFIDQTGAIHQPTAWWTPAAIRATVLTNDRITLFVRFGDLIGRLAVWISMAVLVWMVVRRFAGRTATDRRPT
jgi:apolipoprotein N-acyltransferase